MCTLSLDTPGFVPVPYYNFNEGDTSERVPPLRTLEMANCSDLQLRWLEELRESMRKQGLWAGFNRLMVTSALDPLSVRRIDTLFGEENKAAVWGPERGDWLLDTGKHDPEESDMDMDY